MAGGVSAVVTVTMLGLLLQADRGVGGVYVAAALFACQALGSLMSARLQPNDGDALWQFDEVIFIVAAMLLDPSGVVAVIALGSGLGFVIDRLPPRAVLVNIGLLSLASLAGTLVMRGLVEPNATFDVAFVAAMVLAAVVFGLVNELLLAMYFALVGGQSFAGTLTKAIRVRVPRTPFLIAAGLLAGCASRTETWAAFLVVPLLVAAHYVLNEHHRAERDRERTQGLFDAAGDVHASVRTEDVREALVSAAKRLLRCEAAELRELPPGDAEWGAPLTIGASQDWLVVSSPRKGEPLDAAAIHLLQALVAIGASALENARLVEEIQHRAVHDPLTGLANQVLFEDRVSQAIATSRRNRERFAVMVLDLDAFKKINDSLGHSQGNELLRLMADRLAGSIRDIDTVARLGSDHFTLLLPGIGDADQAAVMCEKLLGVIRRPVSLGGHELFMTASAGLAFFPEDGTRAEHLLRNADGAMHRAKEMGRDTFQVYASGMNEAAHMRLVRESELHLALQRDELRLRYQPQIDLRTGRIVGVEALVRWEHPVLGLIGPHEFVPLAEESGLIVAVDTWVMHEACQQAKTWLEQGLSPLTMAVNLSGRHFQASERLLDTVQLALLESGLDPTSLELEVTEGIAVGEEQGTGRLLQQVRELGVRIAIDDFGTGYSMLGRLQKFPIDKLKIDRSFVIEIETAHGEAPIVAAKIAMARSLKIEVVAEGVETLEQQTFLRFHGCDHAQGFLFSHPVEADEIEHLLLTPSLGFNVTAAQ
jgi:diguanylate cyclase (GGDEF)-like protein